MWEMIWPGGMEVLLAEAVARVTASENGGRDVVPGILEKPGILEGHRLVWSCLVWCREFKIEFKFLGLEGLEGLEVRER
jgi:hypothetical protein